MKSFCTKHSPIANARRSRWRTGAAFVLQLLAFSIVTVHAEQWMAPTVRWQKYFGGGDEDELFSIQKGANGLILLAGESSSTNGTKRSQNFGYRDIWVVAINEAGEVLWEKSYGGAGTDLFRGAALLPDGGWLLAGASGSGPSGNKEGDFFGGFDYWLVRLDATGNKMWDKTYGGPEDDQLHAVHVLDDGTFILAGNSSSPEGGTKTTPHHGFDDGWVLRVNSDGEIIWQQSFGGVGQDRLTAVTRSDNDLLLFGSSDSPRFGGKTSPAWGFVDYWLLRLSLDGYVIYEKSFGGDRDDYGTDLIGLSDGGALLTGSSTSAQSGMKKSPNHTTAGNGTATDAWIIRIDRAGEVMWENSYGGENGDVLSRLAPTADDRFLAVGYSYSPRSGNKTSPLFGSSDLWLMRLDAERGTFWQQSLGTVHPERTGGAVQLSTGEFLIAGTQITREPTQSPDGTGNPLGGSDFVVYKISADLPQVVAYPQAPGEIPNQGFRLTLYATPNKYYRTEVSSDLVNWTTHSTNWLNGSKLLVRDLTATNANLRFYRVQPVTVE